MKPKKFLGKVVKGIAKCYTPKIEVGKIFCIPITRTLKMGSSTKV